MHLRTAVLALWHCRYGGITAEFFRRVAREYNVTDPTAGCFQGEPHVVERVFRQWLAEEGVALTTGQVAVRASFDTTHQRVTTIELAPSGRVITVGQLIDATYEGDLLSLVGVPTTVGRESKASWNESFAGQSLCSDKSRDTSGYEAFPTGVNVSAVDASGALLPGVDGSCVIPTHKNLHTHTHNKHTQ